MISSGGLENLFVATAFAFQIVMIVHFALRKWRFETALHYGPLVYALGIPAAIVSVILLFGGTTWWLWLGGFLYAVWAAYGYWVEYRQKIEWRNAVRWSVLVPYVCLYLATNMLYWFPLALISRSLWYVYAVLFIVSTVLNVMSHKGSVVQI